MAEASYSKPHSVGFDAVRSSNGSSASLRSRSARASSVSVVSHAVRVEKRISIYRIIETEDIAWRFALLFLITEWS